MKIKVWYIKTQVSLSSKWIRKKFSNRFFGYATISIQRPILFSGSPVNYKNNQKFFVITYKSYEICSFFTNGNKSWTLLILQP